MERTILEKQAAEKIQQLGVTLTPQGEISNASHALFFLTHKQLSSFFAFIHRSIKSKYAKASQTASSVTKAKSRDYRYF